MADARQLDARRARDRQVVLSWEARYARQSSGKRRWRASGMERPCADANEYAWRDDAPSWCPSIQRNAERRPRKERRELVMCVARCVRGAYRLRARLRFRLELHPGHGALYADLAPARRHREKGQESDRETEPEQATRAAGHHGLQAMRISRREQPRLRHQDEVQDSLGLARLER